jgi:hypothetical protein
MITFHSRQSDCAWQARKNENAGTVNFASQIASSICTVAFMKCEKSDATIFRSWCSRMSLDYYFIHGDALLLNFVRLLQLANSSPKIRGVPRDGRATFANHPARHPANCLSHLREISRQWLGSAHVMPPNVRPGDSQDNSQYGAQRSRNTRDAVRAKAIETSGESTLQTTRGLGAPVFVGWTSPLRVATGGKANWCSCSSCRRSSAHEHGRRGHVSWHNQLDDNQKMKGQKT